MVFVTLLTSHFGPYGNCVNTWCSPFGLESLALFVPSTLALVVFGARVSSRIGYNRGRSWYCSRASLSFCLGGYCAVVDQLFKESSNNFSMVPPLLYRTQGFPWLVVSDLLLSDRDGKNEIEGAAHDGRRTFWSWLPRGTILQLIAQSSTNFTYTQVLLDVKSYGLSSCGETRTFHHLVHPVLRLYYRCGLGCILFFDRRVSFEELFLCTSAWSFFYML